MTGDARMCKGKTKAPLFVVINPQLLKFCQPGLRLHPIPCKRWLNNALFMRVDFWSEQIPAAAKCWVSLRPELCKGF